MIRRAKVNDAAAIHAVLLAARDDIPLAPNFADDVHKKIVRDDCRRRNGWVFELDAVKVGVMIMAVDEIRYLATAPGYRKQGVAQALVEDAKVRVWKKYHTPARGRARQANRSIVQLLEKLGFIEDHDMVTQPGWMCYRVAMPPHRR